MKIVKGIMGVGLLLGGYYVYTELQNKEDDFDEDDSSFSGSSGQGSTTNIFNVSAPEQESFSETPSSSDTVSGGSSKKESRTFPTIFDQQVENVAQATSRVTGANIDNSRIVANLPSGLKIASVFSQPSKKEMSSSNDRRSEIEKIASPMSVA